MRFHAFGSETLPVVVLLHGGGLSWWSLRAAAEALAPRFHVVLPVLDGHGESSEIPFTTIENAAQSLLRLLETNFGGSVFALGGLSLGAQIALEVLCQSPACARTAVLESALLHPSPLLAVCIPLSCRMSLPLTAKPWFAKAQAKALGIPQALFPEYFHDSQRLSLISLTNLLLANARYALKPTASAIRAKTLVLAGQRESAAIRSSARRLAQALPDCELTLLPACKHGQMSLAQPEQYADLLSAFLMRSL